MAPFAHTAASLLALLLLAGCTSTDASVPTPPTPTSSASPEPVVPIAEPIAVDLDPGGVAVPLGDGWSIQHCEGDAPLLCLHDADGTVRGLVEVNSHPGTDAIARALADGEVLPLLEDRVAEQHRSIAADRARGCGAGYEYRAEPVTRTTVAGHPGVLYAFSGLVDGQEVERHRAWYTVQAGQLWTINAAASAPGSCMAEPELTEFVPEDLVAVTPWLDRVVAGSELPETGRAMVDGIVVATEGGLDGGLLHLLWGGGKQRIQQPAGWTLADVEAADLVWGDPVAELVAVGADAESQFVVLPADGPDAQLHLVVDGVIRPVLVQQGDAAALAAVPDLDGMVLTRVRPAASATG